MRRGQDLGEEGLGQKGSGGVRGWIRKDQEVSFGDWGVGSGRGHGMGHDRSGIGSRGGVR